MDLEGLASVSLVGELLSQGLDDVTEAILERFVHLREISLLVQSVLHFLHPFGEFVSQVIERIFEFSNSLSKCVKCFLADASSAGGLGNFQISEGIVEELEFLLKG